MINILQGLKRFFYGSTYKFSTRKGSTNFNGPSWIPIFTETTKNPIKLISIEFLTEKDVLCEYRIVVGGEKIFPFNDYSKIENGVSRNFILPIEVAASEYLQIEVSSDVGNKNVIIMSELACIEVV